MNERGHAGHAFLDLALVGVVIAVVATIIGAIRGDAVDLGLAGAALLISGAYPATRTSTGSSSGSAPSATPN